MREYVEITLAVLALMAFVGFGLLFATRESPPPPCHCPCQPIPSPPDGVLVHPDSVRT